MFPFATAPLQHCGYSIPVIDGNAPRIAFTLLRDNGQKFERVGLNDVELAADIEAIMSCVNRIGFPSSVAAWQNPIDASAHRLPVRAEEKDVKFHVFTGL